MRNNFPLFKRICNNFCIICFRRIFGGSLSTKEYFIEIYRVALHCIIFRTHGRVHCGFAARLGQTFWPLSTTTRTRASPSWQRVIAYFILKRIINVPLLKQSTEPYTIRSTGHQALRRTALGNCPGAPWTVQCAAKTSAGPQAVMATASRSITDPTPLPHSPKPPANNNFPLFAK